MLTGRGGIGRGSGSRTGTGSASAPPSQMTVLALSLAGLSGPGRVSFFLDYSERTTPGYHTFYVYRTHGSVGAVSVDYATSGDPHTFTSGTLNWATGEMDIKSFTVNTSVKSINGIHRLIATLSNPTGGLELHNGTGTIAYGIIDDGTVLDTSASVFVDADAGVNGDGASGTPYDNPYDAITAANADTNIQYIYLSGTFTPDGTNTVGPFGNTISGNVRAPTGRTSEATRITIMEWPGQTFLYEGANNFFGFYNQSSSGNFTTYRGLDFQNLDTVSSNSPCGAIWYHFSSCTNITIEYCNVDGSNGVAGGNTGAYALWGVSDACFVWRSTATRIKVAGADNHNAAGVYSYAGVGISVQRCTFSDAEHGIFQKSTLPGTTTMRVMFSIFNDCYAEWGISGGGGSTHSFGICQGNLFDNAISNGPAVVHESENISAIGNDFLWFCQNVLDSCGTGYSAAVMLKMPHEITMFNNIIIGGGAIINEHQYPGGTDWKFVDYNHSFNANQNYYYQITQYADSAAMNAFDSRFAGNDSLGDPLFTNRTANVYTLEPGSPCIGTGFGGIDKGVHFTEIPEVILGAA